ncbi:MAG TPA: exonuclease domain-containing protein [Xanthomonadaceae bacterium]
MSFVFFDTETTGLSKAFDQIVHFAAIRTDSNLKEIDRFEIRSRLRGHVIPHPSALWVNEIGISQLLDPALPSFYSMVCAIHAKLLSWSPSIFAGYNSIRFDEELLRQAFYQALYPPYLTSFHNNGRADVLGLALSAVANSSDALIVPVGETGRRSFRLPDLARANKLQHRKAHAAMSDVEATLALCRLVSVRAPQAWQRFVRFSKKATVIDFIQGEDAFLLTEFYSNEAYHTPVVCVGIDPADANARLCLTLNSRTRTLLMASDDEILASLDEKPCPLRRVRVNAAPSLTPLYEVDELEFDLDQYEMETIACEVKADPSVCERLIRIYHSRAKPWPTSSYVEQRIYDGFYTREDEVLMQQFHEAGWHERADLVSRLKDDRLRLLGMRLLHDEVPHLLTQQQSQAVKAHFAQREQALEVGPLSCAQAVSETDDLIKRLAPADVERLIEYRSYLTKKIADEQ